MLLMPLDKIQILDCTCIDGKTVLLDGHGIPLLSGFAAVNLEFTSSDIGTACNSAGIRFTPNLNERDFYYEC